MSRTVLGKSSICDSHVERDLKDDAAFQATDALPGSAEKLRILAWRIQAGLPLWHPNDLHASDIRLLPSEMQAALAGKRAAVEKRGDGAMNFEPVELREDRARPHHHHSVES